MNVQLPDSASVRRTREVMAQVEKIARQTPGVAHTITVSGHVVPAVGEQLELRLDVRRARSVRRPSQPRAARRRHHGSPARDLSPRDPGSHRLGLRRPADPGTERRGRLQADGRGPRRRCGRRALQDHTDALVAKLNRQPGLVGASTLFRSRTPQLFMDIDRSKAETLGVSLGDVDDTLQMFLGSLYVNSFNQFGRYWQVTLQADGRVSRPGRGHQPAPGPQRQGRDGPAGHVGRASARSAVRSWSSGTTCTRRRRSTATSGRASARARRSSGWTRRRERRCRAR